MKKLAFISFIFVIFTSCLFDNREEFYPSKPITNPTVFFASDIFPIIQNECIVCHGSSFPSGSLSLTNYEEIKATANDGRLEGSLTGTNGYEVMPQGNPLPNTQVDSILTWIEEGALNN